MMLRSLKLKNIRSHRDTCVLFDRGVTVITGRTGSGKSSVLMGMGYAIFGSDARIPNSELLRRGSQSGYVELEFEHGGSVYSVRRGLKTQGINIIVDPSNLYITKDSQRLPLLGRAGDLSSKIVDILGYPGGVDPVKLFEVTTYSRQDEIRNLIEMKPTERQVYIDKLLQIQRYQNTWEGMKDILSHFSSEAGLLRERLKGEDVIRKQIGETDSRVKETNSRMKSISSRLEKTAKELDKAKEKLGAEEKEEHRFRSIRSEYDAAKARVSSAESELASLRAQTGAMKKRIDGTAVPDGGDTEKLVAKHAEVNSAISFLNRELTELPERMRKMESLGNRCPLCGSAITEDHKKKIGGEYRSRMEEIRKEVSKLSAESADCEKLVAGAKRRDEVLRLLDSDRRLLQDKEKEVKRLESESKELGSRFSRLKAEVEGYDSGKIEKLRDEYNRLSSELSGLRSELKAYELEQSKNLKLLQELQAEVETFAGMKAEAEKKEALAGLLARLREDIRKIREKVRAQFLAEFKVEFQAKFEEIRQFEEDYSVDIKGDYEPVAYSKGEEVPITALSGGEKTSVALAYRLALADIAAQIGGVSESDVLILDEPTTGFDTDDIRALPGALKNIKTIPQIVIVTHAEELKEAADCLFNVEKRGGVSVVEQVKA